MLFAEIIQIFTFINAEVRCVTETFTYEQITSVIIIIFMFLCAV